MGTTPHDLAWHSSDTSGADGSLKGSMTQDKLDLFLGTIYTSLEFDLLLDNYLTAVPDVLPAPLYAIYVLDPQTGRPTRIASRGVSERFLVFYEQRGRSCDPLLHHATRKGEAVHDRVLYPDREWSDHPVHGVLSLERMVHVLEAPLIAKNRLLGTLNFARRAGQPSFNDADLALAERISRHTAQALIHSLTIMEMHQRQSVVEAALQVAGTAIVLTDMAGNLRYANRRAQDLLEKCEGNAVLKSSLTSALQANLADLDTLADETTRSVYLPTRSIGRHPYLSLRSVRLPVENDIVVTFFYEPGEMPDFQHLSTVLSDREIQVLELLSQGLDNKQIANRLTISVNTVKSHLKRMSAKLQANSRSQLLSRAFFLQTNSGSTCGKGTCGSSKALRPC